MSDWRNKIPHEQVESDPTKQNIITGQLHRLIKLGVLMPEASQISDTGIYVTIGLPSPTVTSKLQVGGTVAANEAEYDYELATLGQVKALAVPTLPQLKTINNESIVGTGNIVISGGVDVTLGIQKNGLVLVGQELSLGLATNLVSGALSNTDWDTFNSKQNALGFTPENIANKNQNNGYAGLDSTGKINPLHLPALAITDTFVVGSESEMLSLVAEVGDVAIRTDLNKSFILCVSGASTLANWQELLTSVTVDQTIIDGSTNAVSGNAVFDGLAGKANLNGGNGFTGSQWFSDFTRHAKQIYLGTNSLNHGSLYSPVALGNINGHFAFASDTRPPVVISTELLTNLSLVKLIVPNNSGTIALLSDIPSSTAVDQTIVDGSTSAVSGNAVFDGLALKANLASPAFTGTPTAPTAITGTNTTQVATTAFVANSISFATSTFVTTNTTQVIGASKTFGIDGQGHGFTFVVGLTTKTAYFTGDAFAFGHISANPGIGRKGNHVAVYSTGTMGFASLDTSLISSGLNNRVFTFPNQNGTFALVNNATSITATSFVKSGAATANILLAGGGDIPQTTFATSMNPTFTGSVVVPNATLATEAVNKGQLDAFVPSGTVNLIGAQTVSGVKTFLDALIGITADFSGAVTVPNPINPFDAATKQYVDAAARPYKVYTAVINQTMANNVSVLFIVENTIGNIIWSRVSAGVYEGTLAGAFAANNKTIAFVSNNFNGIHATNGLYIQCKKITPDKVEIRTLSGQDLTDGVIIGATLEIRVYN